MAKISQEQINQFFQQYIGRDASGPEADYLRKLDEQGGLSAFELGQIVQSLPEAQQRQIQQTGPQIEQALAGGDERFLQRAGDVLTQQFYQQGRPRSSGYTAAYFNAARDLASSRQNILGQYYAGTLGQQPERAFGLGQEAQARGFQERGTLRQRQWDIEDYNRQQADFQNFYNQQRRGGMQSALLGAGIGLGGMALGGLAGGLAGFGGGGFGGGFARGFTGYGGR